MDEQGQRMLTTCHDGALRAWAEGMRQKGALRRYSDDDVVALVAAALDRAQRDHAAYVEMAHARSDVARTLRRYEKLIADALPARSARQLLLRRAAELLSKKPRSMPWRVARERFAEAIVDGTELDRALSLVAGQEVYAARDFTLPGGLGWTLVQLHREVAKALQLVSAGRGDRKKVKHVAVYCLAFVYVKLTRKMPTAATATDGSPPGRGEAPGEAAGDFAAFVEAADHLQHIPEGDEGFTRAVRDVVANHRDAFRSAAEAADLIDPTFHPSFGPAVAAEGKRQSGKRLTFSTTAGADDGECCP